MHLYSLSFAEKMLLALSRFPFTCFYANVGVQHKKCCMETNCLKYSNSDAIANTTSDRFQTGLDKLVKLPQTQRHDGPLRQLPVYIAVSY